MAPSSIANTSIAIRYCIQHCNDWSRAQIRRWTHKSHPISRVDSRFASSQYETALLCNPVSHWLGTNIESALRTSSSWVSYGVYVDGLVQDCSISSALAMEILQSCTKLSISWVFLRQVTFYKRTALVIPNLPLPRQLLEIPSCPAQSALTHESWKYIGAYSTL